MTQPTLLDLIHQFQKNSTEVSLAIKNKQLANEQIVNQRLTSASFRNVAFSNINFTKSFLLIE